MANLQLNGVSFPSPAVAQASGITSIPVPYSAYGNGHGKFTFSTPQQFSRSLCSTSSAFTNQLPRLVNSPSFLGAPPTSSVQIQAQAYGSQVLLPQMSKAPMAETPMDLEGLRPSNVAQHHSYSHGAKKFPTSFTFGGKTTLFSSEQISGSAMMQPDVAAEQRTHVLQPKRKAEPDVDDPPSKVFVNEDRMSARMQGLNLDNNNLAWHPNLEDEDAPWVGLQAGDSNNNSSERAPSPPVLLEDWGESSSESTSPDTSGRSTPINMPKLQLSQELKLGLTTKDLLPKIILDEMAKPTMQVVLWKPPGDFVKEVVQDAVQATGQHDQMTSMLDMDSPENIELPPSPECAGIDIPMGAGNKFGPVEAGQEGVGLPRSMETNFGSAALSNGFACGQNMSAVSGFVPKVPSIGPSSSGFTVTLPTFRTACAGRVGFGQYTTGSPLCSATSSSSYAPQPFNPTNNTDMMPRFLGANFAPPPASSNGIFDSEEYYMEL